ncbi:uncharacterized protein EI90DRAFT_3030784 [Cantharellus anzutake]|uniref:uncharacterized protein n=1 Tax=Cantharellus anzutake TaxID=1750568 RepID=UPI00190602FB|nr:uncharacterized protein EI90DRAFT_3030784 [Cantharellus anzutake]KAF8342945.1 hypothetical protein EI90DRAFT_3030784 [Cantharellus anzutake]
MHLQSAQYEMNCKERSLIVPTVLLGWDSHTHSNLHLHIGLVYIMTLFLISSRRYPHSSLMPTALSFAIWHGLEGTPERPLRSQALWWFASFTSMTYLLCLKGLGFDDVATRITHCYFEMVSPKSVLSMAPASLGEFHE